MNASSDSFADMMDELQPEKVAHLIGLLAKSARAYRLYQANNPVYRNFIGSLQEALGEVWPHVSALELAVEEQHLAWKDTALPSGEGRDNLAFLFYKDGIRQLTLLPGFEEEVEQFLEVLEHARHAGREADDMVTLLWEQDFAALRYSYVDQLAEGVELPEGEPATDEDSSVPMGQLSEDLQAGGSRGAAAEEEGQAAGPGGLAPDDFDSSLYFLDDAELRVLQQELEREWSRDLKTAVLNALFDRLEDPDPADRQEILKILRQLIPAFLSSGDLANATKVLEELEDVLGRGVLEGPEAAAAEEVFEELSDPEVVEQLVRALEEGNLDPDASELTIFLRHVRTAALSALLRSMEVTDSDELRERLRGAVDRLGRQQADHVFDLLQATDEAVAAGAARLVGRLGLAGAEDRLAGLVERPEEKVRLAAVEALVEVGSEPAALQLQELLDDEQRDIRIGAARALGRLQYEPARGRFEEVIKSRKVRDADLTEKIAVFESYSDVAGSDGILLLNDLLNGRTLLLRRRDSEVRACAARALARIGTKPARVALEQAADDPDPVVRKVVSRGLREEAPVS